MDVSLYELILKRNPKDAVALLTDTEAVTFGQLYEMADQAAGSFCSLGLKAGDMVLAQVVGTVESVALLLACSKLGITVMMLTEFASPEMIERAMKFYGIRYIFMMEKFFVKIADKKYVDEFEKIVVLPFDEAYSDDHIEDISNLMLWQTFVEKGKLVPAVPCVHSGAYDLNICFTSGTSGTPKGIVQTNNSICSLIQMWDSNDTGWQPGDRFASGFPLYVTSGQSFCMFLPLAHGLPVCLAKSVTVSDCYRLLEKKRPNVVLFLKNTWMALMDDLEAEEHEKPLDLSGVKIAYSVGGKVRSDEEEKINAFLRKHGSQTEIKNLYGMSEANSVLMQELRNADNQKVFLPVKGVRYRIVDPCTRKELPEGKIGEIFYQTPAVMREYFLNEEKTKEVLIRDGSGDPWLVSGDLGYQDPDGALHFIGRSIEKLVSGENVTYFYEIIEKVMKNACVKDCCMVAGNTGDTGALVVILKKDPAVSEKAALAAVMNGLQADKDIKVLPKRIMAVDQFPLSSGGKIDYGAITRMLENEPA